MAPRFHALLQESQYEQLQTFAPNLKKRKVIFRRHYRGMFDYTFEKMQTSLTEMTYNENFIHYAKGKKIFHW